jgi:NTE family protein
MKRIRLPQRPFYLLLAVSVCCLPGLSQIRDRQNLPRIGLVLSGGGARGASHIGILKVFDREKIPVDCIAATSFGALVGGLYSLGYPAVEIEKILLGQDWNSIFSDAPQRRLTSLIERKDARYLGQIAFRNWKPELPTGLWGGQRLSEALDILTSSRMLQAQHDFDKLPIRFRAVSTNLIDGKAYIFKHGSLTEALRASMAVPLLFTPHEKDGMLLADGGLVDNLPTHVALDMGAETIIAVDATSPLLTKDKIRTFIDVIDQSISLQMERTVEESRKSATMVLDPDLHEFTNRDYDKLQEIIQRGEEEAVRRLEQLKALTAGIPWRPRTAQSEIAAPIIDSISFHGLKELSPLQLAPHLHIRKGTAVDPEEIVEDVSRLYATRLFESVQYNLEPLGHNHYRLMFIVKEAPLRTLGASLRYDNDYDFVVLAEFTARQLFNTPSNITISSQFGGLENHSATFRFAPLSAGFFLEPKANVLRQERLDIRNRELVDKYTDRREGGQVMIGGSILKQLEIRGGYRCERIRISGGSAPKRLADSTVAAGLALRFDRDSLDSPEFPRDGMTLRIQIDKQMKSLGSDLDYSRWQADYERYFSVSRKSTARFHAAAGYSHGSVPFFDFFYVGGHSFSQKASRQFMGLEHDEFAVRHVALVGASYRRQIFSNPLSFIKRGFLTGTYNGMFFSQRQSSPYDVHFFNGAGLGLALDTMLGPVRFAGGWGEGGRLNLYFSLGPSF